MSARETAKGDAMNTMEITKIGGAACGDSCATESKKRRHAHEK
jgi:hypothetical protein